MSDAIQQGLSPSEGPVYIAATRRVRPGMEEQFKAALQQFVRRSLEAPGTTGAYIISPGQDGSNEYGILRSFESDKARQAFYISDLYLDWQEEVSPMVVGNPAIRPLSGLEAFFRTPHKMPPRWKMALVTWLGVFPAVLFWSTVLPRVLPTLPHVVVVALVTAFVVVTLAWGLMPLLTKLLAPWLHK
jgi:antibiotic biosynthesis monooxygenase (ABM) superfamily enzyme